MCSSATATRLHLSVHGTSQPALRQAGQPMSFAEYLMHGVAHASQRAPSRTAVNVDGGAHSVAPSAPATHAGAFGEVDMVADDTNAAGGVAAADWLATTFSSGDFNASFTGARASDVDDGLSPALKVMTITPVPRATCTHCPTIMMTSPLFSPLIMPSFLVAAAVAKIFMVLLVVLPMLVCTLTHRVTMITTAWLTPLAP